MLIQHVSETKRALEKGDIMKKIVNKVRILALVVSALIISLVPVISSKANSTNWNVYYVAGGGNKYETNVFVYTCSGGSSASLAGTIKGK